MSQTDKPQDGGSIEEKHPLKETGLNFYFLFYVGLFAVIGWLNDTSQAFLREWWTAVLAVILVLLVLINMPKFRDWLNVATARQRIVITVFGVVPMIALLVAAIIFLEPASRVMAMRGVFLAVVCLLPATMYYLFIVTRKDSLLNEYITNLDRLGLLVPSRMALAAEGGREGPAETMGARLRLETYVQRFEAVYGPIGNREAFVNMLFARLVEGYRPSDGRWSSRSNAPSFTEVFSLESAVPVITATLLVALGWLMVLPPDGVTPTGVLYEDLRVVLDPVGSAVAFAFVGAYFFSLQMLFRRYVRRDLRSSAYVAVSLRIVLAVIGIWVATQIAIPFSAQVSNDQLYVLGFVLGVFPPVLWQILQWALRKMFFAELALPSLHSELPLSDLDGLTVWHESRLEEEDIENIANMATADLTELMLNTRFPRGRIIDWVDQAILYTALGPPPKKTQGPWVREILRAHGIRSATSLLVAYKTSIARNDVAAIERLLPGTANERSRLRTVVDSLATNTNIELVLTWKCIDLGELAASASAAYTASSPQPLPIPPVPGGLVPQLDVGSA